MTFKKALLNHDFIRGAAIWGGEFAYNILSGSKTISQEPAVLIFANGNVDSKDEIEVIKAVICEDPSNFLEENQDLAKSVKHILICNIDEISQRPNMDVATLQSVLGKYEGFIKRITQK